MFKATRQNVITLAIFLVIGIVVLFKGALLYPDSYAFLDMRFNRSPLYSTFLKLMTSIFGDYYQAVTVFVQYVIIAAAIQSLLNICKKFFSFKFLSVLILQLILLAPLLYWHFTANKILSEALAYPFFIWMFGYIFRFYVTRNTTYLYYGLIFLFLLLLTRGQFIASVVIVALVIVHGAIRKSFQKKAIFAMMALIFTVVAAQLSERLYNKIVHGHFVGNAMSNVHLLSADFYLSTSLDIDLFTEEDQRNYFRIVHQSLEEAGFTKAQVIANGGDDQQQFQWNFSEICNRRVHELGLLYFKEQGLDSYEQHIALNTLCASMFPKLLKANFKDRFKLFFKNLKTTFGTTKYLLLFLLLFAIAIFKMFKTNDVRFKFMALAVGFMLLNNSLIAFVVHPINRYTFYFDWVIFAIILLLLAPAANQKYQHS